MQYQQKFPSKRKSGRLHRDKVLEGNNIRRSNLKVLFQILMITPDKRSLGDIKLIKQILSDIQALKKMHNNPEFQYICRQLSLVKLKNGEFVFQRNKAKLYIILQGRVGLYNREKQNIDLDQIITLGTSECFGELVEDKIKQQFKDFVALTLQDSILAVITKDSYNKFQQLELNEVQKIEECIKDFKPFSKLKHQQLKFIISKAAFAKVQGNTILIKEGQIPKALYLIRKGILKIFRTIKYTLQNRLGSLSYRNRTFQIAELGSGDSFSISYLKKKVQIPYTVLTSCPCELILIPYKHIQGFLDRIQCCDKTQIEDKQIRQQYLQICRWKNYKQQFLNNITTQAENNKRLSHNRVGFKSRLKINGKKHQKF